MKKSPLMLLVIFFAFHAIQSYTQTNDGLLVEVLSKNTSTWDGTLLKSYPEGQPEITISKITMPVGYQLDPHKHLTPLAGYVLSGVLTVFKQDGTTHTVSAGETLVELVDTWHYGKNGGDEPLVLLAFYIGIEGVELSTTQ